VKGIISGMGALMAWTIIPSTIVQTLLIDYYASQEDIKDLASNKRRLPSFRLQRELLDSEGVKTNEMKEETIPSPPLAF
jgi:hypothetical protein